MVMSVSLPPCNPRPTHFPLSAVTKILGAVLPALGVSALFHLNH